jgi:hypothetical protein
MSHKKLQSLITSTSVYPNRVVNAFNLTKADVIAYNATQVNNKGGSKLTIKVQREDDGFTASTWETVYVYYHKDHILVNGTKVNNLEDVVNYITNM